MKNNPNPITEDISTSNDPTSKHPHGSESVPPHVEMRGDLVIVITVIVTLLLIIIIVLIAIKCKRDLGRKKAHACGRGNRPGEEHFQYSTTDSLSTHHSHFGTGPRRSSCKSNGHVYDPNRISTDYENSVLPMPPDDPMTTRTLERFPHLHSNSGTLQRQPVNTGSTTMMPPPINPSDSDSWVESSRSRETSPASSIPPGMPPFRVIPLCESESSGTHISDPMAFTTLQGQQGQGLTFTRNSSNLGSEIGMLYPRSGSEAGSNAPSDNWGLDPNHTPLQPLTNGSRSNNGTLVNGGSNGSAVPGSQPMLRKNQYWV